ncbi:hypothetical protein Tco_0508268 [Tanacetum coccineum]
MPYASPNNLGPDESGVFVNETLFRGMIGLLMYLTTSRPDIQFSTCLCARYQANPKESHLVAIKRSFRYLKRTPNLGLWYPKGLGFDLKAYSDSDYARCNLDRKSTSGGCQILGGKLSSKSQLADYDVLYDKVPIFCDNTSSIAISNDPVLHSRIKHIDIRYHFIRDRILKGDIELHFVPTDLQLADIFTKPLAEPSFTRLVAELDEFISAIGLPICKEVVPLPPKETVRTGLATLGLFDKDKPTLSSTVLVNSSPLKLNPSASVAEVSSASALKVLRRLGSIFTSAYAAIQKLKKDSWLELQFSLVDNSKLSVVYLLIRSWNMFFTSRSSYRSTSTFLKGLYLVLKRKRALNENKFEGDNTPIVIQPPCYSASKTLKYKGGQLNATPVLEVENFTNWKKRFLCHIIGIEPQFENIISNSPFIPMAAGQRKPEGQWTIDERKAANLDQRLKSLIMSVLPDDQMNSVINCLIAKSTWDGLILYHEGPSDVKESRVMDLKLCYNTFKFKEGESLTQTFIRYKALMNELVNNGIKLSKLEINIGFINGLPKKWLSFCQSLRNPNHVKDSELASLFDKLKYEENLIDSIYETEKSKSLVSTTPLSIAFFSTSIVHDFQDSPDDVEDTRSSHEYSNDLEEEYQERALLAKSKRFFKKGTQRDDEEISSNEDEVTEVKALMALTDEERVSVGKESARNGD